MGNIKKLKETADIFVDKFSENLIDLSLKIHKNPELCFNEHKAVKWLTEEFAKLGMDIECPYGTLDTAFAATLRGSQPGPVIGLLAEYDALEGLGHACGHNTKGPAVLGAVRALKEVYGKNIKGTIKVIGTPAEEGGGGKVIMADAGAFDDLTVAIMANVGPKNMTGMPTLAACSLKFMFKGKASHASAVPQDGINALDGVILMYNGINALRQHLNKDVRVHGIITHGGAAANIVPEQAESVFMIRDKNQTGLEELYEKVCNCARAGAMASGSKVDIERGLVYLDKRLNQSFIDLVKENFKRLDLDLGSPDIKGGIGSNDFGNVTQIVPSCAFSIGMGEDLVPHTPEYEVASGSEPGNRALVMGAKLLASVCIDLMENKNILKKIRNDFENNKDN